MIWALSAVGALVVLVATIAIVLVLYGRRIPVGHVVAVELPLRRSPQEVYDLVADVPGHVHWAPRVRSVSEAPPHEGRPAYRMKVDRQEFFFYVGEATPPKAFALTIPRDKMFSGTWTWHITPTPTGCVVRLTERAEIYVGFVRAMLRLLGMETKFLTLNLKGMAKRFGEDVTPSRIA